MCFEAKLTIIFNLGGICERAIRSIRQILTASIKNSKTFNYEQLLNESIQIYNKRKHSSLKNISPTNFIKDENKIVPNKQYPWEYIDGSKTFNYSDNKKQIQKKMSLYEKKFPILSPVQTITNKNFDSSRKNLFDKKSEMSSFSKEIYYIHHLKKPTLASEGIIFKLVNANGEILKGAFRDYEIKTAYLRTADKFTISKVLCQKKFKKNTYLTVKIEQFPKNVLFDIPKNQIQ